MKICLATPDLIGPVRNGGVGTAIAGLADALAEAGHSVTVAFAAHPSDDAPADWQRGYRARGIDCLAVPLLPPETVFFQNLGGAEPLLRWSYSLYDALSKRAFDLLHVPDYRGVGYFPIMARRTGVGLRDTPVVLSAHGPTAWSQTHNPRTIRGLESLLAARMERFCIEQADAVIAPSQYMLDWIDAAGWRTAKSPVRLFNALPKAAPPPPRPPAVPITELVFFGRIEQRKGLFPFLDALRLLADRRPDLAGRTQVTFLGRVNLDGPDARMFGKRLAALALPVRVVDHLDSFDARRYIAAPERLAVIPSLVDNSPCTIQECLTDGVPFLAFDTGGIAELVQDRQGIVAPDAPALAAAIEAALDAPPRPASAVDGVAHAAARQVAFHEAAAAPRKPRPPRRPRLSVCLLHRDRPAYLTQALDGFQAQTYRDFEIVLVDNASQMPDRQAVLTGIMDRYPDLAIRLECLGEHRFPAAARNHAAGLAESDVLKFHDDDNVSMPEELAVFAAAMSGPFDIVTCGLRNLGHRDAPGPADATGAPVIYGGDLGPINRLYNLIGDSNLVIDHATFDRIGGFVDLGYLYHAEDWLFLTTAIAKGARVGTVPQPLLWYRREGTRHLNNWRKLDFPGARFRANLALGSGDPEVDLMDLVFAGRWDAVGGGPCDDG